MSRLDVVDDQLMSHAMSTSTVAATKQNLSDTTPFTSPTLSEQDLLRSGYRPIRAWMPAEKSRNAERVARSRVKREQDGVRQLNLLAPIAMHDLLKEVVRAAPDQLLCIQQILAPKQPLTEAQVTYRKFSRAIAYAEPDVLVQIERVLERARMSESQKRSYAQRQKEQKALIAVGQRIASLNGWRRLFVQWIARPEKQDPTRQ